MLPVGKLENVKLREIKIVNFPWKQRNIIRVENEIGETVLTIGPPRDGEAAETDVTEHSLEGEDISDHLGLEHSVVVGRTEISRNIIW